MLSATDSAFLLVLLESIKISFQWGENEGEENEILNKYNQLGGKEKLEGLLMHKNEEIYKKASELLENYYKTEEKPKKTSN